MIVNGKTAGEIYYDMEEYGDIIVDSGIEIINGIELSAKTDKGRIIKKAQRMLGLFRVKVI